MIEILFMQAVGIVTGLVQMMLFMVMIGLTILLVGSAIAAPSMLVYKILKKKRGKSCAKN